MSKILQIKHITRSTLEEKIDELLNDIYYTDGSVDIYAIAKQLDIKICEKDIIEDNVIAYLEICNFYKKIYGSDKVIFIDEKYYANMQRFCIAELLSDFIYNYIGEIYYKSTKGYYNDRNLINNLGYNFALSLLMPKEVMMNKYNEYYKQELTDVSLKEQLSLYFDIPYDKVEERLNYLLGTKEKSKTLEYKKI